MHKNRNVYIIPIEEHNLNDEPQDERRNNREEMQDLFNMINENHDINNIANNSRIIQLFTSILAPNLQDDWLNSMNKEGCSQGFIDSLPRVPNNKIPLEDNCPICFETYGQDEYPLLVKLPHCGHIFDLQCIALWLTKQTTCPLCRDEVKRNKLVDIDVTKAELEENFGMFG